MDFLTHLQAEVAKKKNLYENISRRDMIEHVIRNREALVSADGALARWTEVDSTGRSPKDTLTVRHESIVADIDWESPNNLPLAPDTFQMILSDVLEMVRGKERIYVTDRVVGADSRYALPVRTVTDQAVTALFSETMFRPIPADLEEKASSARSALVEALAEGDPLLLEDFVAGRPSSPQRLRSALRAAVLAGRATPVLCGSAFSDFSAALLLDAVAEYLPSP
ncbi:MAG TPA: phosphoenolpyruvate carboxykinase (ATP), partial [Candidatus Aminicenantes bacterium]|nr:phosphoenolpyruvate carboxykinase (ATP) [Candidatus Aminicenantes bacterium]